MDALTIIDQRIEALAELVEQNKARARYAQGQVDASLGALQELERLWQKLAMAAPVVGPAEAEASDPLEDASDPLEGDDAG